MTYRNNFNSPQPAETNMHGDKFIAPQMSLTAEAFDEMTSQLHALLVVLNDPDFKIRLQAANAGSADSAHQVCARLTPFVTLAADAKNKDAKAKHSDHKLLGHILPTKDEKAAKKEAKKEKKEKKEAKKEAKKKEADVEAAPADAKAEIAAPNTSEITAILHGFITAAETALKDILKVAEDAAKVGVDPVVAHDVLSIVEDSVSVAADAATGNASKITGDVMGIVESASQLVTEVETDVGLISGATAQPAAK